MNPSMEPTTFGWSRRRWQAIGAFALIALTLVVYLPSMAGDFVWDDSLYFGDPGGDNTQARAIQSDDGLRAIWFSTTLPDYWPLSSTLFWLEWRLWGENPLGYRVVNLLLHAFTALTLWRALRRLGVPGAYLAASVFAVHPVAAASVAWISESKNTLSQLLFAVSLLTYLRFEDTPASEAGSRRCWYTVALASFLLALLAKTSVIMLPALLLILAWWRRQRIGWADMLPLLPFFALSLLLGVMTVVFQHLDGALVRPVGLLSRMAGVGWCLGFYLYKSLLPIHLAAIYPRWDVDPLWLPAWAPLLAGVAVIAIAWRFRHGWGRAVLVALAGFSAILLPVAGLLRMDIHQHSLVADHLQYAGLIIPAAFVVGVAAHLAGHWRTGLRVATGLIVLAVFSGLTWQRAQVFTSNTALWNDTLEKNAGAWGAHYGLGIASGLEGDSADAIRHYREALKSNPAHVATHVNLGHALQSQGRLAEATHQYRSALKIDPYNLRAHINLGSVLQAEGMSAAAVLHYREALTAMPDFSDAHYNLGVAFESQGDTAAAIHHYRTALRLNPDLAAAHHNLGSGLQSRGETVAALKHFRAALAIDADMPETHMKLGNVLQAQGRVDAAVQHFRVVLTTRPDYPQAHFNLGNALQMQGNIDAAVQAYRDALSLAPDFWEAHYNLALAFRAQANSTDAVHHVRAVLRIDPGNRGAQDVLDQLLGKAADRDETGLDRMGEGTAPSHQRNRSHPTTPQGD